MVRPVLSRRFFMNCYIVRVYRREADNPEMLVGVVEDVEKQIRHTFTGIDELWAILNPADKKRRAVMNKKRVT